MEIKVNEFLTIVDETVGKCGGCTCGKYTHVAEGENGATYHLCEKCFDRYFIQCKHCGRYILRGNALWAPDNTTACINCYDSLFTRCGDCGKLIKKSESIIARHGTLCKTCASHYKACPECGATRYK